MVLNLHESLMDGLDLRPSSVEEVNLFIIMVWVYCSPRMPILSFSCPHTRMMLKLLCLIVLINNVINVFYSPQHNWKDTY